MMKALTSCSQERGYGVDYIKISVEQKEYIALCRFDFILLLLLSQKLNLLNVLGLCGTQCPLLAPIRVAGP